MDDLIASLAAGARTKLVKLPKKRTEPPPTDPQVGDEERLSDLRRRKEECDRACAEISRELALLESAEKRREIESIALSPDKKLIDLLIERILDPSPDWKSKIDVLINIPNSMAGGNVLLGGSYFEALFQLAIAIGSLPQFAGRKTFYDIKGYVEEVEKPNYIREKTVLNAGGGETGIADIMFQLGERGKKVTSSDYSCGEQARPKTETTAPYYFISVKGYRREKSIAKEYDIPILFQQLTVLPHIKNKNIVVCVRNKEEFLSKLGRTKQEFLKNSISQVVGYDEVMESFDEYRRQFFLSLGSEPTPDAIQARVSELFPEERPSRPQIAMYFHQELVVKAVMNRIQAIGPPEEPHFMCIGVLPRGGKSFIAGGIIDAHRRSVGKATGYNALFLTSAVTETREQFRGELVDRYSEFSTFKFVDVVGKESLSDGNNFVFISRQLSSKKETKEGEDPSVVNSVDIVGLLKKRLGGVPTFDICFFDEAHIGIQSETVRDTFARVFAEFKMPIILMSATYAKPARVLASKEDIFIWDLQDIKDMKGLPVSGYDGFIRGAPEVLQRYPGVAEEILLRRRELGQTEESLARPYVNFPTPNFISLTFTPDTIENLREMRDGYDYMKAFKFRAGNKKLLNPSKYEEWGKLLSARDEAIRIRQFLTPEETEGDDFLRGKERKYRAFNQIFKIAHETGSRPAMGQPFSVLMFLPFGEGTPIGELCRIWASFMREIPYWRDNFVFLTLSVLQNHKTVPGHTLESAIERGLCHREDFKTGLKDTIKAVERAALEKGKGLVLLSGDVAKMGISLKCVDVVCMMTNNSDADDLIQKMYRALTDDPPNKKNGFIIDLNIKRIVRAMFDYSLEKARRDNSGRPPKPIEDIVLDIFQLCNWGQDAFIEDVSARGESFDAVMETIKSRVLSDIQARVSHEDVGKRLGSQQVEFILQDRTLEQEVKRLLKSTTGKRKPAAKRETLLERSPGVPSASNAAAGEPPEEYEVGDGVDAPGAAAAGEPSAPVLTDDQIRAKMTDIVITFINSLVIKSSEKWDDTMTLPRLLEKFRADKTTATRICQCRDEPQCKKKITSNTYDAVFCELKPYAMSAGSGKVDDTIHEGIMRLLEDVFERSDTLAPEWNVYINGLISELKSKSLKTAGGRRRARSWKNRPYKATHVTRRKRS